jgi:hypothetical protein
LERPVVHKFPEAQDNYIIEYIIKTGFQEIAAAVYEEISKIDDHHADEKCAEYVIIVSESFFSFVYKKCKGQQQEEVAQLQSTATKKIKRL